MKLFPINLNAVACAKPACKRLISPGDAYCTLPGDPTQLVHHECCDICREFGTQLSMEAG